MAVGVGAVRAEAAARVEARERFLSPARVAGLALFVLFAASCDVALVTDDGVFYYAFLRKLLGTDVPAAAYQFGSAYWNVPFYLASRLVALRGQLDAYHAGEVGITVASNAAVVACMYLGWRILRELDLPRGPGVLLLAVFGTPLFYYGTMQPSYKHAADALYCTTFFWLVQRRFRGKGRRVEQAAIGACIALMLATRYANAAQVVAVAAVFLASGRRRELARIALFALLAVVVVFGLPMVRHIPYATPPEVTGIGPSPPDLPALLGPPVRLASSDSVPIVGPVLKNASFSPTAPLKMLFTLHRGLFVWTPLTALATIGFVLLLRRDRRHRTYLAALGLAALALLVAHGFWGSAWDGGESFSQRYLTSLFPFFLVGVAELVRRFRAPAAVVLTAFAGWSLWIALVKWNGYYHQSDADGVVQFLQNYTGHYHHGLRLWSHQVGDRISGRWQVYWRLVT